MRYLLMLCFVFMLNMANAVELKGGVVLNPPKPLPEFVLQGPEKQAISQKDFQGHWSLLFFGFTQCQQVCPMTLSEVKQAYEWMQKHHQKVPVVTFVSVDVKHDTPEITTRYAKSFNANFVGLSGEKKQIELLTKSLGVLYMTVMQNNQESIDHSANLFLINPAGQVQAIFSPPYESLVLAKDIAKAMAVA